MTAVLRKRAKYFRATFPSLPQQWEGNWAGNWIVKMSTFGHLSCQVARWAQGWPLPCPYSSSLQVSSGNRYLNVANSIMGPFPVLILPLKSSSVQRGSNTFLSNKMVRLTLAHCYQRLPNVNSSLELVSTPMVEPWDPQTIVFIFCFKYQNLCVFSWRLM